MMISPFVSCCWVVAAFVYAGPFTEAAEYCWESFNVTCQEDEVVLMLSASYGRMKFGRCLQRDYYVGCSADILPYMDRKCSGRRACALDIPDTELHSMQPCPKDLVVYLEANYACVKVALVVGQSCRPPTNHLSLTENGHPGFISNVITSETGQGSPSCPWVVTVSPGQRINVTLFDFAVTGNLGRSGSHLCIMYGVLREMTGSGTEVTVCGGEKREKFVYLSERNRLMVDVIQSSSGGGGGQLERPHFLLKYEAVGCPDLRAPPNGWADRHGDRATVSCNHSADVWHLVCNGNGWIGMYHNCTAVSVAGGHDAKTQSSSSYPFGVFMAVTIGIALGVFCGLLLLSMVICCQRKKKRFRLCLSSFSESNNWVGSDDLNGANCDLEKTRVLLTDNFCYDLVSREISHPARCTVGCASETCACGTTSSFPVPLVNQRFQLQQQQQKHPRQRMEHCYESANFATMATRTNCGLAPDIQFGLEKTRKYFNPEELG